MFGFGLRKCGGVSKLKKGQRECPALSKTISSQECGSSRGSRYACTAECPHNPFTPANYGMHAGVETALIQKMHARAASVLTGEERKRWHAAFNNQTTDRLRELLAHSELMLQYHVKRDADGHSFAGRWLLDPRADLTNDERVLLKAMDQSRPMLFEVQRLLDEQTFEGIDLLTGKTLRLVDRSAASRVCRYTTFLGWWYPMPFYERLTGNVQELNEIGSKEPLEVLQEIVRHLGGPSDEEEIPDWLALNFFRVCEAVDATAVAVWARKAEQGDLLITKTDYMLSERTRLERLFKESTGFSAKEPEFEDEEAGFDKVWLVLEDAGSMPGTAVTRSGQTVKDSKKQPSTVLGRVLLGEKRLRIETVSEKERKTVRGLVEKLGGECLQFKAELAHDLAAQIAAGTRPYDAALVPESLLKDIGTIIVSTEVTASGPEDAGASQEDMLRRQYKIFVDAAVPALGGLTPRAAAGTPENRALLVALMKSHIRNLDQMRRNERIDFDLNPLLEELGLHELVSTPPPLGGKRLDFEMPEEDEEFGLSVQEMTERLARMTQKYPDNEDALAALRKRFPGILEAIDAHVGSKVEPASMHLLRVSLVRAFFFLAPEGSRVGALSRKSVIRGIGEELEELFACMDVSKNGAEGVDLWITESVEPAVLTDIAGILIEHMDRHKEELETSFKDLPIMLAVVSSVVQELSLATSD